MPEILAFQEARWIGNGVGKSEDENGSVATIATLWPLIQVASAGMSCRAPALMPEPRLLAAS
jgi:hypothetical protein